MKKYISVFVLLAVLLSPSFVKANDGENRDSNTSTSSGWSEMKGKREEFREKVKTEREAFMAKLKTDREKFLQDLKAKREEWKNANKDKIKEFWNRAKEIAGRRFEAAISNLEKVQGRAGEMIDKLKTDGKDTADATDALTLSKSKLASAKAKLAELKALLPSNTDETITADTWEKIKTLAREAKDLLKESKEALRDSIKAIKDLKDDDKDED